MNLRTMRPDDGELVRQATRAVRRTGAAVVFGGLRSDEGIRVSATSGAWTDRLTSIMIRPARGLGGVSWQAKRPVVVQDYARASEITHDFDAQILGEGIVALAVAPIIVAGHVRGLLYAGHRDAEPSDREVDLLARTAATVADEIRVRDLVDERMEMHWMRAAASLDPWSAVRERIGQIADDTSDARTAARLRAILAGEPPQRDAGALTTVHLTRRQRDVLALVSLGLTNGQIASRLGLSEVTVKSYLRAIMSRLEVRTRTRAVLEARRLGLL